MLHVNKCKFYHLAVSIVVREILPCFLCCCYCSRACLFLIVVFVLSAFFFSVPRKFPFLSSLSSSTFCDPIRTCLLLARERRFPSMFSSMYYCFAPAEWCATSASITFNPGFATHRLLQTAEQALHFCLLGWYYIGCTWLAFPCNVNPIGLFTLSTWLVFPHHANLSGLHVATDRNWLGILLVRPRDRFSPSDHNSWDKKKKTLMKS